MHTINDWTWFHSTYKSLSLSLTSNSWRIIISSIEWGLVWSKHKSCIWNRVYVFVKLSFILRAQFHCLLRLLSLILIFNSIILLLSSLPRLSSFALSHSVQWQIFVYDLWIYFCGLIFSNTLKWLNIFDLQFHLICHCAASRANFTIFHYY